MNACLFWLTFVMGAIGMLGDFVVPSLLARSYPRYSNLRDTISTLGTTGSPVKSKTTVWLVMQGLFLLVFAVGQAMTFCSFTWRHLLYLLGIVMFGVGAGIVAGLFPEDPPGVQETGSGKVHGIGAGIGSILLLLSPLWARGIEAFKEVKDLNAAGFAVGLVAFVLFIISGKNGRGWLGMTGLWQRIYLAVMYAILLANAFALRKFWIGG